MIQRVIGDTSRVERDNCKWRKLQLEPLFTAYHLVRGGITDSKTLKAISNADIHACAIATFEEKITRLLVGKLPLFHPVRCGNCGGVLTEIPCSCSPWKMERYKTVKTE